MAKHSPPTSSTSDDKYQAEEDLRTMKRAMEIHADKMRFGRAMKMAKTEMGMMEKMTSSNGAKNPFAALRPKG